jgi:DNA polymerase III delta subunit
MTIRWAERPSVVKMEGGFLFDAREELERAGRILSGHVVEQYDIPEHSDNAQQALFASGLFAPPSLTILWGANAAKQPLRVELERYEGQDGRVLVLVSKGRRAAWYNKVVCDVKETFASPRPWELGSWVKAWAKRRGYELEDYLADALVQNVGSDPYALTMELSKSFLLMGERRVIEPDDLTRVLVQHESLKPWLIVDAWAARKSETADRLLTLYLYQTQDAWAILPLVALLLKMCQQTLYYVSARSSGMAESDISKMLGVSGKAYTDLSSRSAAWDVPTLRTAYAELCEIEVLSKTGGEACTALHLFMNSNRP